MKITKLLPYTVCLANCKINIKPAKHCSSYSNGILYKGKYWTHVNWLNANLKAAN